MGKLVVVGPVSLDHIKTPFGEVKSTLGGAAAYFALAASFFTDVALVSNIGEDFPHQVILKLRDKGINVTGIRKREGKSAHFDMEYDESLYDVKYHAIELGVTSLDMVIPPHFHEAEMLYLATSDPETQLRLMGKSKAKLKAIDSHAHWIDTKRKDVEEAIKKSDICFLNDIEARKLTNERNLIKAGRKILAHGPKVAVIKKGEHGALVFSENSLTAFPAVPLADVTDPTGCGDSFAGGFCGYLCERGLSQESIKGALVYGNVIASFVAEGFGTQRLWTLRAFELQRRIEEFKKMLSVI